MKMNTRDAFVNVVRDIEENVPGLKGFVEWESRQVNGDKVTAASFIRTSVACFALGISGVQNKTSMLPDGIKEEEFSARAVMWFSKVLPPLLSSMRDRRRYVTGSPAIWAGLGAMGHTLINPALNHEQIKARVDELSAKLNSVIWTKSDSWLGIAIKATKNGYSFAGGAKDSGSTAYRALSNEADDNYTKIRM